MKIRIPAAVCCLLILHFFANAQRNNTLRFGFFETGYQFSTQNWMLPVSGNGENLSADLSGFRFGGGGYGRVGEKWLLGGYGFGLIGNSINTLEGNTIRQDFGGGFLHIGRHLLSTQKSFSFLYGGVGGAGLEVEIENNSRERSLVLDANSSIGPGRSAILRTGGWGWDVGLGWQQLLFHPEEQKGGWTLGLQAGFYSLPQMAAWQFNGNVLESGIRPDVSAFYIRAVFGGGWR